MSKDYIVHSSSVRKFWPDIFSGFLSNCSLDNTECWGAVVAWNIFSLCCIYYKLLNFTNLVESFLLFFGHRFPSLCALFGEFTELHLFEKLATLYENLCFNDLYQNFLTICHEISGLVQMDIMAQARVQHIGSKIETKLATVLPTIQYRISCQLIWV